MEDPRSMEAVPLLAERSHQHLRRLFREPGRCEGRRFPLSGGGSISSRTGARLGRGKGLFLLVVAVVGGLVLAACSPAQHSVAGLSVTPEGKVVAVLRVCSGHLDWLELYQAGPSPVYLGEWKTDRPITGTESIRLDSPGPGWKLVRGSGSIDLKPGERYFIEGLTQDNSQVSTGASFKPEELPGLPPGMVRYTVGVNDGGLPIYRLVTLADFEKQACAAL